MIRWLTILLILSIIPASSKSQTAAISNLLDNSSMLHSSVSICILDPSNGKVISEYDSQRSLTPASVMKLVTTAAVLELIGPDYRFNTVIGYTGTIDKNSKTLIGNIIIKGGGDPSLGSENFKTVYGDFIEGWADELKLLGISKIEGCVLTDDSYYDYEPVPSKWLWEDIGNYYGAGSFGLSVFDNYYSIHLQTSVAGSKPKITSIVPDILDTDLNNFLVSGGTRDYGYIFGTPYSSSAWISGTIPENRTDFVLKGSIPDPPLLAARLLHNKLVSEGIIISGEPSTRRIQGLSDNQNFTLVTKTISPPVYEIINILNHESTNLYAESLTKQLGLVYRNEGSTSGGIGVITEFLKNIGFETDGIRIVDGSGLSPVNAINAADLANLLVYMKTKSKYSGYFYNSLPEAGKKGTLSNYFTDPVFANRVRMKTGSMSGVRSFAGYVTSNSGKEIVCVILVNNYTGPSANVISGIENIVKQVIIEN